MTEPANLTRDDITVTEPAVIRRAVGAAAIGNVTEWYDFGVYGYLATTIEPVFFQGLPPGMGMIATFGIFAVSFLVRPFGGLFFGPLGDKIGRKRVLSLTVILMALGTFCLGLIPSYASIGVAAPMLALLARLVQGFSTGGEYGSAMTFIAEYAPDRRRGFFGSWLETGTMTGYAFGAGIATILTATLSDPQLYSWGWRIPFFVALPLGLVGLYLRSRLEDSPAFEKLVQSSEHREGMPMGQELKMVFARNWPALVLCMVMVATWNITNYMLTSYMPTYLTETLPSYHESGISTTTSHILQIIVLVILMVLLPVIGRLCDRVGRRPVLFVGCVAMIVLSFPSVMLIREDSGGSVFGGLIIMGLMLACFSAVLPSTLPALFPTYVRAGALSIAFNISVSAFGGTTSTVMGSLVLLTNDLNWPAYYLIAAGVVGLVAVVFMKESAGRQLPGSGPTVTTEAEAEELVGTSR
jgi:MHS family proline/betaine transporter-like MFS transporter